MIRRRITGAAAVAVTIPLALAACSSQGGGQSLSSDGRIEIPMWTHTAGNENESNTLHLMVDEYNASQDKYKVVEQDFPQDAYNDSIQGAAASGDLACIVSVDGPVMPTWAWNGWMVPSGLTDDDVTNFLPSTVGRYNGEIYSIGYFDVTTLLFSRSSTLEKYDIRIPTVEEPWTAAEVQEAEDKIKASGDFDYAIDWGPGGADEWWPYAYAPLLQSFGGDLIDRDDYETVEGVLNGPEAVAFGEWFKKQFDDGYAPRSNNQDRTEFINGDVAIKYDGSWGFSQNGEAYDDLIAFPLPDFGNGPKAGVGSWQYGLTSSCSEDQKAGGLEYLKFSMNDKYIAKFSDGTSLIPATTTAWEQTEKGWYGPDGTAQEAAGIAEKYGMVRPQTPAYNVMSRIFDQQLRNIVDGTDPQSALDQAAKEISTDIQSAGYNK